MTATSILMSRGWDNFREVEGGFDRIIETNVTRTDLVCSSKTQNTEKA